MAHGIKQSDAMAYAKSGGVPWHGIGTPMKDGASIEEMLDAAKLGWEVCAAPLYFIRDQKVGSKYPVIDATTNEVLGHMHPVRDQVIYRGDTGLVLDVVGPDYIPAQNTEVLEFFREYLDVGSMMLETVGSLWDGRYVWGLAKLKAGFTLPGGDHVEGYLLICNPNKYGAGLIVKFVMERVVCHNTLTMALNENGAKVTIAHNRKFDAAARSDAKEKIGLAKDSLQRLEREAKVFSATTLADKQVDTVLGITFKYSLDDEERPVADRKVVKHVKELYEGTGIGADMMSAKGTAWGLLNAVTQFVDHEYGKTQDGRLRNSWFGGGETTKRRARRALWAVAEPGGQVR